MKVILIEPASIELDDAIEYYDQQIPGLGKRFYNEVEHTIELIKMFPKSWPAISKHTRKATLMTFPYNLIYSIEENNLIIFAIAHHHRKPEYWIDRLI